MFTYSIIIVTIVDALETIVTRHFTIQTRQVTDYFSTFIYYLYLIFISPTLNSLFL